MTASPSEGYMAPAAPPASASTLLSVTGLHKHFPITRGIMFRRQVGAVQAVDGLDFSVRQGETLGLVGESGCGKTTTGRLLTRLLEPTGGQIVFEGHDITHLRSGKMRPLRRDIQMIFQDPYSSLNPRHTVGTIVGAPFRLQKVKPERGIKTAVQDLLELVGLNPEHYNRYPHEFSGGQRQRIGIARTLALRPKLIVADEPVSALDVSIQAQVVNLLEDLQEELDLTYVVIAHDLSVVRHISDRVAVMYLGKIVELASSAQALQHPAASLHGRADVGGARHPTQAPRGRGSGSGSRATCRARSTRRRRAASTPGAGRRRRSAAHRAAACRARAGAPGGLPLPGEHVDLTDAARSLTGWSRQEGHQDAACGTLPTPRISATPTSKCTLTCADRVPVERPLSGNLHPMQEVHVSL